MEPDPDSPRYKLSQRILLALLPPVAAVIIRLWARSWRVRVIGHSDPRQLDPRHCAQRYIYAFWHEGVVTIIPHWRDCQIQGLASQSFDGALISALMRFLGFPPPARGSSSRGGAGALKAHIDSLALGLHVAISVDGPRGPRYQSKPGVVQLAALSGHAIVPVSGVALPDVRLRNWDQTMVPPPFARLAFVLGEPIVVTPGAETEALERLNTALMAGLRAAAVSLDGL